MTLAFTVPGPPIPKARPRVVTVNGKSVSFTPARTRQYERDVRTAAMVARGAARWRVGEGDTFVVLIVVTEPDKRRRDIDNIGKAILDALNGVAWADDSDVDELRIVRAAPNPARPRVDVRIDVARMAVT